MNVTTGSQHALEGEIVLQSHYSSQHVQGAWDTAGHSVSMEQDVAVEEKTGDGEEHT